MSQPKLAQDLELGLGLDALGDDADAQAVGQRDHGLDDRPVRLAVEPGHERPVDLDRVEGQVLQVGQRRVAGAEVVEDEPDAHVAQPVERPDARPRTGPSRRSR